ncbi:hypothetical protein IPJ91_01165 [bacterium]|nr:MAG: hypothetical protein IPJ91_01165 [bacterium]
MFSLKYTQNFFTNSGKVKLILANQDSSLPTLEIGGGHGEFSKFLKPHSIILEKDIELATNLKKYYPKLNIYNVDFFDFELPDFDYQVLSNLPFAFTSEILTKLMKNSHFQYGVFIVQKEVAEMFMGVFRNNLKSIVYQNYFGFDILMDLSKNDFKPKPSVETQVIRISRIKNPLICGNMELIKFEKLVREIGKARIGEGDFLKYIRKNLRLYTVICIN